MLATKTPSLKSRIGKTRNNQVFDSGELKFTGEWIVSIGESFLRNKAITPQARFLFILLKSYTNNKRKEAFPSIKTLTTLTGWSSDTIIKYLNELEVTGFMKKTREGRKEGRYSHNIYLLQPETPTRIYRIDNVESNKYKIIIIELFSSLIKVIENDSELYSITNKFRKILSDKKLIKILADCNYRDMKFDNESNLAAYLQACIKNNGKVTDSIPEIKEGAEAWMR